MSENKLNVIVPKDYNGVPIEDHHNLYDGNREFRRSCTELVNIVRSHDKKAANRYFGL